jgi:hypothetical protein
MQLQPNFGKKKQVGEILNATRPSGYGCGSAKRGLKSTCELARAMKMVNCCDGKKVHVLNWTSSS